VIVYLHVKFELSNSFGLRLRQGEILSPKLISQNVSLRIELNYLVLQQNRNILFPSTIIISIHTINIEYRYT